MKSLVYGSGEYEAVKKASLDEYGVVPTEIFDVKSAIRKRIDYLKNFLKTTEKRGYVLGISGGVDSTTTGRLAQLACEELRAEGYFAQFIAMRLPAGTQLDEADAQAALKFINPDKTLTVNIGEVSKLLSIQAIEQFKSFGDEVTASQEDFFLGNLKARIRMTTQYHTGSLYNALILGTDHSTEGICGFWTKWADGSCDLLTLNGLNKRQVRLVAKELGAPKNLYEKVATADLEVLSPQKTDEDALGIKHDILDDFLERKKIDKEIEYKIVYQYWITEHKRKPIPGFSS